MGKTTETMISVENKPEAEEICAFVQDLNKDDKEKFLFYVQGYKRGYSSAKEIKEPINQSA